MDSQSIKEGDPTAIEDRVGGVGSVFRDSMFGLFFRKAEVNVESMSGGGWSICQGSFCGARVSRRRNRSVSFRSNRRDAISARTFAGPGR